MFCGVSSATVSRYFSGQSALREEARKKIETAAKKPDIIRPTATAAAEKNNSTIVVLFPHLRHTFFADILEGCAGRRTEFIKNWLFYHG